MDVYYCVRDLRDVVEAASALQIADGAIWRTYNA